MNKKNKEIMIKAAMRRFPFNLYKISKGMFSMIKSGENSALPWKLQFESAGICNLRCIMCPQNHMKREKGFLKFEVFKKVYDEVRPPYLNLTGIGEPMMNSDIFKIISYARKNGSYIKLDTNATLLDDKKIDNLLDTGIDIVSVSLDGMDKKTYESIRIGANFETVIKNLRELVKRKKQRKSKTEIHMFLVLQKSNFRQFLDFVKFGDSIGVDSMSGTFVAEESYDKNKEINIEQCSKEDLENFIEDLKKLKNKISANLEIDELIEYVETWENKKKTNWSKVACFYPWYAPFITWDGILTSCCYCVDKEIVFGDLKKQKFKDVWNNKKIGEFRKMVSNSRVGLCSKCEMDETYIENQFKKIPLYKAISKRKN